MDTVRERIFRLRQRMAQECIDAYIIPTGDYHGSEYVSDYFKVREYYSGFTGSNGTLVVLMDEAGLWTDGRYFIQAERELCGSGITLYRMNEENVPSIEKFLEERMKAGGTAAADGRVVPLSFAGKIERACKKKGGVFLTEKDIAGELFLNRPKRPCGKIRQLPLSLTGEDVPSKLSRVRTELAKTDCDGAFFSRLDDIMWLFNIRGNDVRYNPVALSYAFIDRERAILFVQNADGIDADGFVVHDYEETEEWLQKELQKEQKILVDKNSVSIRFYTLISRYASAIKEQNPVELLKAVKNETEIRNLKDVYLHDSVAVTKFICWIKQNAGKRRITETDAADYLHKLRTETAGFEGESFSTISAYRENAAMMHYEPDKEHPVEIEAVGTLLVDSGGQYAGGTTDVTRTIVLGPVSEKEKLHFTKVAAGMLRLSAAKFLSGCTGRNLDILARQPLWELGIDYKCGTGHGIGYMLNVHEGPQAVRWKPTELSQDGTLKAGMLLSDEPGVYLENEYGIRTENALLVKEEEKTPDGQFLSFEMLTFVPIDRDAIEISALDERDRKLLNEYHQAVYEKTAGLLTPDEAEWLMEATKPL